MCKGLVFRIYKNTTRDLPRSVDSPPQEEIKDVEETTRAEDPGEELDHPVPNYCPAVLGWADEF